MDRQAVLVACLRDFSVLRSLSDPEFTGAREPWLLIDWQRTGEFDSTWLRARFSGPVVFSPGRAGTHCGDAGGRRAALLRAAAVCDLIELDADIDLEPAILSAIPAEKRMVAWQGLGDSVADLRAAFGRISRTPAKYYKLVTAPGDEASAIVPLLFLNDLRRRDTIAWASGEMGMWTRLIAPRLGAPIIFGNADSAASGEPGEPSIRQLTGDYGLPSLPEIGGIYGIAGKSVMASLSPRLHNAAYASTGQQAIFLPFQTSSLDAFHDGVIESPFFESAGMPILGLTLASPNKESALALASERHPMVRRAQSSNLLVRTRDGWVADTTDPDGVLTNLREQHFRFSQAPVAVVGCGGSGRAVAAALRDEGAAVTLVNRSPARGHYASLLLGLPFVQLDEFEPHGYSAVINATPVGQRGSEAPFLVAGLSPGCTVVDHIYRTGEETALIAGARARGCATVCGRHILLAQVRQQFRLMTGVHMPADEARRALNLPTAEHTLAAVS